MKTPKPLKRNELVNWLNKKGYGDLADYFEGHLHELYDHQPLTSIAERVTMLEDIEKKWRGKRACVVTLVLTPSK